MKAPRTHHGDATYPPWACHGEIIDTPCKHHGLTAEAPYTNYAGTMNPPRRHHRGAMNTPMVTPWRTMNPPRTRHRLIMVHRRHHKDAMGCHGPTMDTPWRHHEHARPARNRRKKRTSPTSPRCFSRCQADKSFPNSQKPWRKVSEVEMFHLSMEPARFRNIYFNS